MAKAVPATGISLREAVQADYLEIAGMVRAALEKRVCTDPSKGCWVDMDALYPDRVVICQDGKHYSYPYTIDANNNVLLGDPAEVIETYVAAREASAGSAPGVFVEAVDGVDSGKWLIRVMRAGMSANANFYPDAVLRESAPLFEGARVFIKSDIEHVKGAGKDVRNLVGGLSQVRYIEGASPDTSEIQAVLTMIEPAGDVAVKLREASGRGMANLFGFSIDAEGKAKTETRGGKKTRVATAITKINSVDLIVEPAAGGELIRMVESVNPPQETDMLRAVLLQTIKDKSPAAYARLNVETATVTEIEAAYREAVSAPQPAPAAAGVDLEERIRMIEARAAARAAINASTLPPPAKERLLAAFEGRVSFKEADVTAAIDGERAYLARFAESGHVELNFDNAARVEDRSIKIGEMLDAFFDPSHKDHGSVTSFKEAYVEITGDSRVTGRLDQCDRAKLRESVGAAFRESLDSTSFASVLGDSITRRLVADYRTASIYDVWRQLVTVSPVSDFRTQERTRYGGYGDLPGVNQGAAYQPLTSPSDEKATYGVTKRGGTEDVTLEMIKNDDVGAIRMIPTKLSRAAKRTLGKFVLDFLRTNPAIYDTKALFHVDHGNLGTAALDATSWAAARLAMMKQAEAGSNDRLGIGPKNLWVPADLEAAAHDIFKRGTNLDATFVQTLNPNIIPVWYWTDANDWVASADPLDIPTIEIGFLDGNEEPDLFVQDNPSVGSMFTNDKVTYKIRHAYGGNVLDYRGLYKGVVA